MIAAFFSVMVAFGDEHVMWVILFFIAVEVIFVLRYLAGYWPVSRG